MANDFLRELEFLGVTARIKRLSDTLSTSIKVLYKENGFDIEPSWHLLFLFLKKQPQSTMSEIAEALQYSQPAITKIINRMKAKGYIDVMVDKNDSRKKILTLSKRAKRELPKFEKVWDAGQKSIREILKTKKEFINYLEIFETEIKLHSFNERALTKLEKSSRKKK
jgi:DNA-binding MarR family transcriptional regulator